MYFDDYNLQKQVKLLMEHQGSSLTNSIFHVIDKVAEGLGLSKPTMTGNNIALNVDGIRNTYETLFVLNDKTDSNMPVFGCDVYYRVIGGIEYNVKTTYDKDIIDTTASLQEFEVFISNEIVDILELLRKTEQE